jgi:HEPN domain-containing protein
MSDLESDEQVIEQWVRSAWSDLLYAEIEPPAGVMYEQLCFHAQQAAEKALKALLQAHDEEPPYIHDIRALTELLRTKVVVPERIAEAASLTQYAVLSRYPPFGEPVNEARWREATAVARVVVEWVEQQLAAR